MGHGASSRTTPIFDFDNHYYESVDAFTRYQDPSLRGRGIRWADIDGRRRLLVGGTVNFLRGQSDVRSGVQAGRALRLVPG